MEHPLVFKETHKLIFKLIGEGKVAGLRVDHPDGLYNPSEYFRKLQKYCFFHKRLGTTEPLKEPSDQEVEILKQYDNLLASDPQMKSFFIVGEKILIKGEKMPDDWPISGTTGYAFLNSLNGIFVETSHGKIFDDMYTRCIRSKLDFHDTVYEKKKLIMEVVMSSEVNTLGHYLDLVIGEEQAYQGFHLEQPYKRNKRNYCLFPGIQNIHKPYRGN